MAGGLDGGTLPFHGLAITTDENGDLVDAVPMNWAQWCELPVREQDFGICTKNGAIRVPSVIVAPNYDGMPLKAKQFSSKAVRERDGNRCQVTNRVLAEGEGNLGHNVARSKGGARSWENIVYMDKRLNTLMGTKTFEEMGWKLLKEPKAPAAIPACAVPAEAKLEDQKPFVK